MSRTPDREIVQGYIQEVKDYLLPLREGIAAFRDDPENRAALAEVHRMVHTIKGASAMLDMTGLSRIALLMEDAAEAVLSGRLIMDDGLFQAMADTIDRFDVYCQNYLTNGVNAQAMLAETQADFKPFLENCSLEQGIAPILEQGRDPKHCISTLDNASAEILESFYEEAQDHLQELGRSLDQLSERVTAPGPPGPDEREILGRIRRAVHTLKGAAGVTGLSGIADFAHHFEDILDWLCESARELTPEAVSVLMDSADLLEEIVDAPESTLFSKRIQQLREAYADLSGAPEPNILDKATSEEYQVHTFQQNDEIPYLEPTTAMILPRPGRSLRVDMAQMDELVNLSGECIIAGSAFDRQMAAFQDAVGELELARKRLREIARKMELGYEVKGLGRMGTATASADAAASDFADFDPLELDRYSELNLIIRTLNESVIDAGTLHAQLAEIHSEMEGSFVRQRALLSELQDKMTRTRMTPGWTITHRLRRTVQDAAARSNKTIKFEVEGADIELDRGVWEKLADPLMHILRNAADHGIESPEQRKSLGKPTMGTIHLKAAREGNQVAIRIADDGAGLDYAAIRRSATEAGLVPDNAESLENSAAAELIFLPGFSTRRKISSLSGRGVGMDVVRENIQEINGVIQVSSQPGKGTIFTIRLPLTLAAVRALMFTVARRIYAIPLNEVSEIFRVPPDAIVRGTENGKGKMQKEKCKRGVGDMVRIRDKLLPLYDMAELLSKDGGSERSYEASPLVIVAELGLQCVALIIDGLAGQREIVIKSTGSHLRHVKGVSGVTIMGDGSLAPILNIAELVGEAPVAESQPFRQATVGVAPTVSFPEGLGLQILVVDDSVSVRQVISRLLAGQGWRAETAKDGVEALERLQEFTPDIIVLDIEMPRMNGYEFLNAVNARPDLRDIPVVVLTSRTAAKHRQRAISLGAQGYVVKPYDDAEFIDLVARLSTRSIQSTSMLE